MYANDVSINNGWAWSPLGDSHHVHPLRSARPCKSRFRLLPSHRLPKRCKAFCLKTKLPTYLSLNPEAGALIAGTGGARKLRWAAQGKGQQTGGRTIYYYHSEAMPLLLMDFYTKGEKRNLTAQEKKSFRAVIDLVVQEYVGKG